jgi:tetratricopeptide (TPR) repeat protein
MNKMIGMGLLVALFMIIYNLLKKGGDKIKRSREDSKLGKEPNDVTLNYKSALRAVNLVNYDEAILKLNKVLEFEPEHTGANLFLGLCYCGKSNFDKAEKIYERELNQEKIKLAIKDKQFSYLDEANFYFMYGYCLFLKGNIEEAKKKKNYAIDLAYVNGDQSLKKSKLY